MAFLSDADVGIAPPKLMSDADVGLGPKPDTSRVTPDQAARQSVAAPVWTEAGPFAGASETPAPQSQAVADVNSVGQGVVQGTGGVIAGAGRLAQAGQGPSAERVLTAFDLVDQGQNRDAYQKLSDPERQQVGAYRSATPEDKAAQRAELLQDIQDYQHPNALTRAGMAVQGAAPGIFPVSPENEGFQTRVASMVGGAAPAILATAATGPAGLLAGMATIATQAYDGTFQAAVARGASHEEADNAAGKNALAQAITMAAPVGRLLQRIPIPLRDGAAATLVNLGQHGVEFGTANALGTFMNNYVASQTYNPTQSLMQGTGQAGLEGFVASLIIRAVQMPFRSAPRDPGSIAADVMNAPDVNSAISAATEASGASSPEATGAPRVDFGRLFDAGPMGAAGGSANVLTMPSGRKLPFSYDVVEARDLIPASGDLQPRDRGGRLSSNTQISKIATNLDPELLHASPGPDQGAPTVTPDGVVLAGNGRTQAIRQAYAAGGGDAYRAMIGRYGFDTTGMTEPVLIRRLTDQMSPDQQAALAVESNVSAGQRMSATEQSAVDARGMSDDMLARYNPLLTDGPTAAGNRDFVRSWVGTLPESERNSVLGADGALSADGVRRLQGAMLARAYRDKGTLARSLESTDDNARAITGALIDAAPAWAQLRASIAAGEVPPTMDVAPQLMRAVEMVRQAREKGQSIRDVLSQSDAFNPTDPITEAFVRAFYNPLLTRAVGRPLVGEILRQYATEAAKVSDAPSLFGDAQPQLAPADILATVVSKARSEPVSMPMFESVGAAGTPGAQSAMDNADFLANRHQGEVERLAMPPAKNDRNIYIPDTKPTLAEVTGNPVDAMDQAYNRQQPEAMTHHIKREEANADLVAAKYANTAGSATTLLRMERDRSTLAAENIRKVFGDPTDTRPPADPMPTLTLMREILHDPRQGERDSVIDTVSDLSKRLFDKDGKLKTDPYQLYGVGDHINDLLSGVGDTKTSSAARVLKRELMQIKESLYNDIEKAAPGFAKYREDYQRDSRAIDALRLLQEERLSLLNGVNQRITPAKWFKFMRDIVEARTDPMDPASSLSEDQMDALWNITDHLKRQTLLDVGKPRGSWTSMMQEWGGRFARLAAHGIAAHSFPVAGNVGIEMGLAALRKRAVDKEMDRVLNPDITQRSYP